VTSQKAKEHLRKHITSQQIRLNNLNEARTKAEGKYSELAREIEELTAEIEVTASMLSAARKLQDTDTVFPS
jgi:predicted nuclease with TOPRIM domain